MKSHPLIHYSLAKGEHFLDVANRHNLPAWSKHLNTDDAWADIDPKELVQEDPFGTEERLAQDDAPYYKVAEPTGELRMEIHQEM